jgi:hypothetical protein
MKHKAVSADPSLAKGSGIQAADKIHLRVVYASSGGTKSEKVLWYRKVGVPDDDMRNVGD